MTKGQGIWVIFLLVLILGALGVPQVLGFWLPGNYEYTVGSIPDEQLESQLNALGKQGWEVVFARRAVRDTYGDSEGIYEFVLMRKTGL